MSDFFISKGCNDSFISSVKFGHVGVCKDVPTSKLANIAEHEANIKMKKTLTEVRELLSRQPEVQKFLCDAMQGVMCTLNSRFSSMKIKEEVINIAIPATDDEITNHFKKTCTVLLLKIRHENNNLA